jgi:hypothetical protein
MPKALIVLILLTALVVIAPSVFAQESNTMTRDADPVFVPGGKLAALYGTPLENIGAFALVGGSLIPIPFQIDQMDAKGELVFPEGPKKTSDDDPSFDATDQLLFMVRDAGSKAASAQLPAGASTTVEVLLTDPADGGSAWIYVAAFAGPAPRSDVDYVRFDPAKNMIHAQNYVMGFSETAPIAIGYLSLTEAGGGLTGNQADRLKIRFNSKAFDGLVVIEKNEEDFSSEVVAWIDGPIRIVRRTKNRMTLFWKIPSPSAMLDNIYYANYFEFPIQVNLPFDVDTFLNKPKLRVSTDGLCSTEKRVFFNEKNPNPVEMDGVMTEAEKALNLREYDWMVVKYAPGGPPGGWMNRMIYDKGETKVVPHLYYNDDMAKPDGPETEPGQCGDVGYTLENMETVEKGVLKLTSVMYNIPEFSREKIPVYMNILDKPIQVNVSPAQ